MLHDHKSLGYFAKYAWRSDFSYEIDGVHDRYIRPQSVGGRKGSFWFNRKPLCVTERSNAATEERLKSGHAVGGMSKV